MSKAKRADTIWKLEIKDPQVVKTLSDREPQETVLMSKWLGEMQQSYE